jgi:hypothetical protein
MLEQCRSGGCLAAPTREYAAQVQADRRFSASRSAHRKVVLRPLRSGKPLIDLPRPDQGFACPA